MTTIKISQETHKRLLRLKGELMSAYEQDFTFDDIINAILEHLEHSLVDDDVPYTLELALLPVKWPTKKRNES